MSPEHTDVREAIVDIVALIAERKIEEAIENGLFDNLPAYGAIDCSLRGEAFLAYWLQGERRARTTWVGSWRGLGNRRLPQATTLRPAPKSLSARRRSQRLNPLCDTRIARDLRLERVRDHRQQASRANRLRQRRSHWTNC